MKKEESNRSAERILLLVTLLVHTKEGYCRQEIIDYFPAYGRGGTRAAQQKMLDRDFSTLEKCGITLLREDVGRTIKYRVSFP